MRIAEVLLRPMIGGAERLVDLLSAEWTAAGHEVRTFYVDDGGVSAVRRATRLRRALHEFRPDVVQAHSAIPNIYSRIASMGLFPVVVVLHSAGRDFDNRKLRALERVLARTTKAVIAVSSAQVDEYGTRFGRRDVHLIPNGIRSDIPVRDRPTERPRCAVAISRLAPQKRIDVLIEGWTRAAADGWSLRIAGSARDSSFQRSIEELVERAGPSVELLGDVDDIPKLLSSADLFLHAADREAHPLAPLEAAAAGIPIVISDAVSATLPEFAGKSFVTGDSSSLAESICDVLANYESVARSAVAGAACFRERFSIGWCSAAHLKVLHDAKRGSRLSGG